MVDPVTAISVGSQVLGGLGGLLGKKKKTQAVPIKQSKSTAGYQTLADIPYFDKNKISTELLPKMYEEALQTPYWKNPTRRLTAEEMTGDFAPKAVMELQNYFDKQAAQPTQAPAEATPDYYDIGQKYVDAYGNMANVNPTYWNNLKSTQKFDYSQLGKILKEIESNPDSFALNEQKLRGFGLGYNIPAVSVAGAAVPIRGIPGYAPATKGGY